MKTQNVKIVLLVLCFAVCVGMGRPWGDNVVDDAKNKAGEVKHGAASAVNDATQKTDSFAKWAYHKFTEYSLSPILYILNYYINTNLCF